MRDSVPLERYFDLFKHLCAANVLAAPVVLVLLGLVPVGSGPFDALVLCAFFASFVFAARGAARALDGAVRSAGWDERGLRRKLALAVACFSAGTVAIASSLAVAFLV